MSLDDGMKRLPPKFVMLKTFGRDNNIKRLVRNVLMAARNNIDIFADTNVNSNIVAIREKLPIISVDVETANVKYPSADKILRISGFHRLNKKTLLMVHSTSTSLRRAPPALSPKARGSLYSFPFQTIASAQHIAPQLTQTTSHRQNLSSSHSG